MCYLKITNYYYSKNFSVAPFALLSRYRTVTPLHRYRDRPSATDTIPLHTVTDHYLPSPTVTITDRYSPFPTVKSNGE